jgi:integrin alpha 6
LKKNLQDPKKAGLSSSFGYSLAVLDYNSDGYDDLIVGAPQYFHKSQAGSETGGAAFIFLRKGSKIIIDK